MAWIELAAADIQEKISSDEYEAITEASLPDGVTGPEIVTAEIGRTVAMVRGYVAANAQNLLGSGEMIPEELSDAALCILRHKVFTRIPGMKRLLDEGRVREYEDALRQLKDVAAGRFKLVAAATPAEDQAGGGTVQVIAPSRTGRESRATLNGGGLL